jgi:hypothetical protein
MINIEFFTELDLGCGGLVLGSSQLPTAPTDSKMTLSLKGFKSYSKIILSLYIRR